MALSLDLLAEFFAERMDATDGAVVSAALRTARNQFQQAEMSPEEPPALFDAWPEAAPFETALLAGRHHDAGQIMNDCLDSGRSLVEIERRVVQPALYQIGEKWQTNQISVAREHMATAIVLSVMTMGLLRSPPPAAVAKLVVLACVEGNDHTVGLRMVGDAFQLAGWNVQYLGANVPTAAVIQQVAESHADLVGVSVAFPQQLRVVKLIIAGLENRFGSSRPAVIIGGQAVNRFSRLAEMVGADGWGADAQAAVTNARQLVGV